MLLIIRLFYKIATLNNVSKYRSKPSVTLIDNHFTNINKDIYFISWNYQFKIKKCYTV